MIDPAFIYRETAGLAPLVFPVDDVDTGDVGEQDQRQDARKAALGRAHEIRQFEIELYWKRANYFWLLQAAVFAALGLTWKSGGDTFPAIVPVALASLGTITAVAGWLSSQGSKFWQENWEHHIDMLEDEFEGRLHKTAYVGERGIRWSVSGINDRLSVCFLIFWCVILAAASVESNPLWTLDARDFTWPPSPIEAATAACLAGTVAGGLFLLARRTRLRGETTPYATVREASLIRPGRGRPFLIRREPRT